MQKNVVVLIIVLLLVISITGLIMFYYDIFAVEDRGHGAHGDSGIEKYGWLWLFVFSVPLVLAVILVLYRTRLPDKTKPPLTQLPMESAIEKKGSEPAFQAVLRVLSPDEKKVVEALAVAKGSMLQKDIRWKTGLTRVQTHRIIARLAERDIVHLEKHFNTNKVTLSEWVIKNGT